LACSLTRVAQPPSPNRAAAVTARAGVGVFMSELLMDSSQGGTLLVPTTCGRPVYSRPTAKKSVSGPAALDQRAFALGVEGAVLDVFAEEGIDRLVQAVTGGGVAARGCGTGGLAGDEGELPAGVCRRATAGDA